jgi:hypothetical protein
MKIWSNGQISTEERADILGKHRHIYNGYKTMHPDVSNSQPLYVQDFANDKGGLVVNNKGEVKSYTNFGINEQLHTKVSQVTDLKNVHDLDKDSKFDYTEEFNEQGGNSPDIDVDDVVSAYNFNSNGPMDGEDTYDMTEEDLDHDRPNPIYNRKVKNKISKKYKDRIKHTDESYIDEVDEDLQESFKIQKSKISEMFNRFKKYN